MQRWQIGGVVALALGAGIVGGAPRRPLVQPPPARSAPAHAVPSVGSYIYPNSITPPISLPLSNYGQQEYERWWQGRHNSTPRVPEQPSAIDKVGQPAAASERQTADALLRNPEELQEGCC
jgi:hypothetical protein